MAAAGLLHLWSKWGIQIMVLVSFSLQVFLLALGGIRRRSCSDVLRLSLWLAYQLADATAIYTLGHLSVVSGSREHQLVAFWAPFLLVHLGGPDNITAYALEDNRLWLRHLQTLTVQVLGAAYVVYRYMASSGASTLLLCASISLFVVGVFKYGERTWSLKRANMSSIRNSIRDGTSGWAHPRELLREGISDEEVLLQAHFQFFLCKCVFTDAGLPTLSWGNFLALYEMEVGETGYMRGNIKKRVELELSLMYDTLYTKAAVIHTRYGFYIHLVSLLGTVTGFLLFCLSISSGRGSGYSRVDVIVSYVLLVGALALEATSMCRAVLSSWTSHRLCGRKGKWKQLLLGVITSIRRRVQPARRRLWSGSIGQYNLLHLATRDRNELWTRLAMKMGLQDWWSKLHFSGTFSPTDSFSMQDLDDLVLPQLWQNCYFRHAFTSRGKISLEGPSMYRKLAEWSVNDIGFNDSILVWHIATDVYIRKSKNAQQHDKKLVEATQVLSNYMMFLLVVKPHMLPGHTRHEVYTGILRDLDVIVDNPSPRSRNPYCMLKLFQHQGPGGSRIPQREKLVEELFSIFDNNDSDSDNNDDQCYDGDVREADVKHGLRLAKELLDEESSRAGRDALKVVFQVWVETMLYAAEHCSRDSHARELSNGGEFITIMWLLFHHLKDYNTDDCY